MPYHVLLGNEFRMLCMSGMSSISLVTPNAPIVFFLLKYFNFMIYIWVCVYMEGHMLVAENRRGHQVSWRWSHRYLWDTWCGYLEMNSSSLKKAISAFHCWATFSSPDLSILNAALPSTMPRHFQNGKFMYLSHLCFCFSWRSYRNKKSWWAEVVRFNLSPILPTFSSISVISNLSIAFSEVYHSSLMKSLPLQIAGMIIC